MTVAYRWLYNPGVYSSRTALYCCCVVQVVNHNHALCEIVRAQMSSELEREGVLAAIGTADCFCLSFL